MWIARDKNNQLFAFTEKPVRNEYDLVFDEDDCLELNSSEYPEVTWENSPIEIKTVSNKGISIDWEQRKYEVAKDVLAACFSNSDRMMHQGTLSTQAKDAIEVADALIEELKK